MKGDYASGGALSLTAVNTGGRVPKLIGPANLGAAKRPMLSDDDLDILMRAPLFRAIGEKIAVRMIGDRQPRDCARGELIFEEGEPAAGFFCVIEGWAKLYRLREGGAEIIVALVAAGETFAEAVMFSGGRYPVSCEAATRARLLKIDAVSLRREVMAEPQLAFDMLAAVSIRLRELVNEVEQIKARSAPQRIAAFLIQQLGVATGTARLTLPYEKALIAARLGMQPESFSRALGKLTRIGVVVDRSSVVINNVARLAAFAEGHSEGAAAPPKRSRRSK